MPFSNSHFRSNKAILFPLFTVFSFSLPEVLRKKKEKEILFENYGAGPGAMTQLLRALTAPTENLGSSPSAHMTAHTCL